MNFLRYKYVDFKNQYKYSSKFRTLSRLFASKQLERNFLTEERNLHLMKIKKTLSIILVAMIVSLQPALVVAEETILEQSVTQEAPSELKWMGTVKLSSGNLNIRKGPSIEEEIIGRLANETKVEVLEQSDEWATISHNGSTGFVSLQFLTIAQVDASTKPSANQGNKKIIVLDPGHGGKDPGAITKDGTYESVLVWQYTLKAKKLLEKSGYIVYLTRDEKSSCMSYKKIYDELDCRATFAEKVKGDIFISIHADSNPSNKFRGTVTFYNDRDDLDGNVNPFAKESKRLAQTIHSKVQPVIGTTDRRVHNKNYYVNRMNSVPSILIELGVMTNASDLKILKSSRMQDKFALALVKSVDQYYGY